MKLGDMYPSRYLKTSDVKADTQVTILGVEMEEIGQGAEKESKPIVHFVGNAPKPLVLNKTNALVIGALFGDDTTAWAGKSVLLYPAMVQFRGSLVASIRVRGVGTAAIATGVADQSEIPF